MSQNNVWERSDFQMQGMEDEKFDGYFILIQLNTIEYKAPGLETVYRKNYTYNMFGWRKYTHNVKQHN